MIILLHRTAIWSWTILEHKFETVLSSDFSGFGFEIQNFYFDYVSSDERRKERAEVYTPKLYLLRIK